MFRHTLLFTACALLSSTTLAQEGGVNAQASMSASAQTSTGASTGEQSVRAEKGAAANAQTSASAELQSSTKAEAASASESETSIEPPVKNVAHATGALTAQPSIALDTATHTANASVSTLGSLAANTSERLAFDAAQGSDTSSEFDQRALLHKGVSNNTRATASATAKSATQPSEETHRSAMTKASTLLEAQGDSQSFIASTNGGDAARSTVSNSTTQIAGSSLALAGAAVDAGAPTSNLNSTAQSTANGSATHSIESEINSAVDGALGSAVEGVAAGTVDAAVNTAVDTAVNTAINDQIAASVNQQVNSAVAAAVDASVTDAIAGQL